MASSQGSSSGSAASRKPGASLSPRAAAQLPREPVRKSISKLRAESDSDIAAKFLAALDEPIRRPAPSPLYVLALFIVAALMVLLPLLYLAIIAFAGYGVYRWAIFGSVLFQLGARGYLVLVLGAVYLMPVVAGGILVLFMLKPLFARHRSTHAPQALNRDEQPVLYAFVDKLCDKLGAPRPARIDIDLDANASASFKSTWSVLTGSLVLTIGLPLVATMTGRQFVGVLAHEFGHFAQRVAMRTSFLIICINRWFARAVYERDSWDEWLIEIRRDEEQHWAIGLTALLASFFVFLARRVLWVLMHIGALFSSVLMKQMEYNADRYCSRVVGAKGTIDLLNELPILACAETIVNGELGAGLREGKLPESVPDLIARRSRELSAKARKELVEASLQQKAPLLSTHPSMKQRIDAATRDGAEGPFQLEQSAASLIRSFGTICKLMTQQNYRDTLGKRMNSVKIITLESADEVREERRSKHASTDRFHGGLLNFWRGDAVPNESIPAGLEARCEMLLADREAIRSNAPKARPAIDAWEKSDDRTSQLIAVRSALTGTVRKIDASSLKLAKVDLETIRTELRLAGTEQGKRAELIAKLIAPNLRRVQVALAIDADQRRSAQPDAEVDEYDLKPAGPTDTSGALVKMIGHLRSLLPRLRDLRELFTQQASLLQHFDAEQRNELFVQAVISNGRKMFALHKEMQSQLAMVKYPFTDARIASGTLAGFAIPELTADNDIGGLMQITDNLLAGVIEVYFRTWSELTVVAERVEAELGLDVIDLRDKPQTDGKQAD
jgi:Zn-dependent protease with chaperone function